MFMSPLHLIRIGIHPLLFQMVSTPSHLMGFILFYSKWSPPFPSHPSQDSSSFLPTALYAIQGPSLPLPSLVWEFNGISCGFCFSIVSNPMFKLFMNSENHSRTIALLEILNLTYFPLNSAFGSNCCFFLYYQLHSYFAPLCCNVSHFIAYLMGYSCFFKHFSY